MQQLVIGSDVTALFRSLSAERTAQAVRNQVRKSKIKWENVDDEWMRLYVHLNRDLCSDISSIKHLLPWKKKGRKGQEAGMGSTECRQRYITPGEKSCWDWPREKPTSKEKVELIGAMLEISIMFFFKNFIYNFGGVDYLQGSGGPIGARLTMCVARIVLQEWSEIFSGILRSNNIRERLRAIYVDDGRGMFSKLNLGQYYDADKKLTRKKERKIWRKTKLENKLQRSKLES